MQFLTEIKDYPSKVDFQPLLFPLKTSNLILECRVDDDVKSRISVYNQAINKTQQVPKLRNAIFNPIVQRRKLQQQDEHE